MKYPDDFVNKIICGDCLEVTKEMPDGCVDLVLTDPPYGISRKSDFHRLKDRTGRTGMNFGDWDNGNLIAGLLPEIKRVLKQKGAMLCFYDQMKINKISKYLNPRRCIYWKKTNPMPIQQNPFPISAVECILYSTKNKTGTYNGDREHNWFECESPLPFERKHPTQKPLKLIEWFIKLFSDKGDLILDPFLGSGTTAEACKLLKRDFIGIEINPDYCKIAEERLAQGVL